MHYTPQKDNNGNLSLKITKQGQDVIHNPILNKGTAFTKEERSELGLEGLLPPHISTMDEQLLRIKEGYDSRTNNVGKYVFIRSLQDRNETLFYAFLQKNIKEMLPIIYTPTVGEAVQKHGHIYRHARGLYITPQNIGKIKSMATELPSASEEVKIIVVTDSEGILGIGDQGVGGMSIPIGKLSIYTVAAGIHPANCLPICLDVGTNNQTLLNDPLYLGKKEKRLTGDEYYNFIDEFVNGVKNNFPNAILQWEDFSKLKAFNNMDGYRDTHPSFNDDIEGTGAVTLAGILSTMKIKKEKLTEQKFAIYGAGAAGIGIARQLKSALMLDGLSEAEALAKIFIIDSVGLLTKEREADLDSYKREFVQPAEVTDRWVIEHLHGYSLYDVVSNAEVSVLIGVSAQKDSFNDIIIDSMLKNSLQPVIFPLSNPTSRAEADPRTILTRSNGAAIVASGSPFDPVEINGRKYHIGQGNNALVFPGIGLGALVAKASVIKPSFFSVAAKAVADSVSDERLKQRIIFPDFSNLLDISLDVAVAVYKQAMEEGVGTKIEGDIKEEIRKQMWRPEYLSLTK